MPISYTRTCTCAHFCSVFLLSISCQAAQFLTIELSGTAVVLLMCLFRCAAMLPKIRRLDREKCISKLCVKCCFGSHIVYVYVVKHKQVHVHKAYSTLRVYIYMEIHAYENKKEKKGNPPNHYLDKQTYIARDTWMPSLENWGGGLKIFCG